MIYTAKHGDGGNRDEPLLIVQYQTFITVPV